MAKGQFHHDHTEATKVMLEVLRANQSEEERYFLPTVEEDKWGCDVWRVGADGKVQAVDFKVLMPVPSNDRWMKEIPIEVVSYEEGGKRYVGWAFDEDKLTDAYVFVWNGQNKMSVWGKAEYTSMIWAAIGQNSIHKQVNNPNGGVCWYVYDHVADALIDGRHGAVAKHAMAYRDATPAHLRGPRTALEAAEVLGGLTQTERGERPLKPSVMQLMAEYEEVT
jgi:hypothetical protein